MGDDEEIWQKIIRKSFPDWEDKNYIPEDEESLDWYRVFLRYQKDKDQELEAAKAALKESYRAAMRGRAENVSHKVEAKYMPKPPKDPKLLANAGIPLSRRNYDGSHKRFKPVGFIGQAATGIKRQRNVVELARKEAAAQVAMRKQAKQFMPESTSQIRKAPASLVQQHETEDRQKRLAPPPMPDADKPKKMDPVEARIARIKAAKAEREAEAEGLQMKKEEEDGRDVADLFDDSLLAPSERKSEAAPARIQLPGGGMARKLAVKISPTPNPAIQRPPPKKVDIFFTGKKKPVRPTSPPTNASSGNTSTGAIPDVNLNDSRTGLTPAKLPPRMTSMAQGARGALRPTGTVKERKAVEMKSMRPVNAVADRQGAGRPSSAAQATRPTTTTSQRPTSTPQHRPSAPLQRSGGGGGVASMLAGLVAKQDAQRLSHPPQSRSVERPSLSLKHAAPAEALASPPKRRFPEPSTSSSMHASQPERSSPSARRVPPTASPAPPAMRIQADTAASGSRYHSQPERSSPSLKARGTD